MMKISQILQFAEIIIVLTTVFYVQVIDVILMDVLRDILMILKMELAHLVKRVV